MKIEWRSNEGLVIAFLELEDDSGKTQTLASVEIVTLKNDTIKYRAWTCLGGIGTKEYKTRAAARRDATSILGNKMREALGILEGQDNSPCS